MSVQRFPPTGGMEEALAFRGNFHPPSFPSSFLSSLLLSFNFPNLFLTGETTWTDAVGELNAFIRSTFSSLLRSGAKMEWAPRKLAFDPFLVFYLLGTYTAIYTTDQLDSITVKLEGTQCS